MLQRLKSALSPQHFLTLLLVPVLIQTTALAYILARAETDTKVKSDAIIVLGSRSKILVAGGYNPDDHLTEAVEMAKYAEVAGAKVDDLILETKSTSTYENLLFSQKTLRSLGLDSVIIVSEPYHLPRADLIAQKLNVKHTVSPATNSPCWNEGLAHINFYSLRDASALVYYKLTGKVD
ncbi:hypothetical protein A2721_00350 [Candidatus Gottesmanbacteria bacterium RIFCSPHIGHO2_01_FULL_47_48]|uniref:DUF218 domain-containing protein n=1 Tax=Candidatus Gottesmanbacteria bacterium RIFCSPHIGHO2_01_FULL_47_48 TaxID=1798381 RepID=A0A1F6A150_9BACT|nr:MAG: hypothetical protein A2721_00350 [Candidatus Gottesmanbacteria bacterium RIFCSPHIGHO2_01_FULL_47_48]